MRTLVLLLSICFFMACDQHELKKQELKTDYSTEIFFIDKDSLKQGTFTELDLKGDTISKANYVNNKLQGARTIYHQDGYIATIEHYENGEFHGPVTTFYPNGEIETKGSYTYGQLDSLFYSYYESGKLKEKLSMRDNMENGPFEEYYENGTIHWKGTFIDGDNEVGLLEEYDISGQLIKRMDCGKYKGEYICQTIWDIESGEIIPKLKYED